LDLWKFKSVACWYDERTGEAQFETVSTKRAELHACESIRSRSADAKLAQWNAL
jgi:hypothetical protein